MKSFLRILALPLAFLYGLVTGIRNWLYDNRILQSKSFDLPVISVGNLSTGGTGKSPHIEYLIRLLKARYHLATLSRGYGRKSSGFILATEKSASLEVGDEPKQFKRKFEGVMVAVDINRVKGIKKLLLQSIKPDVVLLDDAFQHRSIHAGLSILLTDYKNPFYKDFILPSGNLREARSGMKRADIIIVTKTPKIFSPLDKRIILKEIKPEAYQKVFFSYVKYGDLIPFHAKENQERNLNYYKENHYSLILFTGIANPLPLETHLKKIFGKINSFKFSDHHEYSIVDLMKVKKEYHQISGDKKIILTTEKDAMRLDTSGLIEIIQELPVFYLPIEIAFHDKDEEEFNKQVLHYVKQYKRGASTHHTTN